MENFCVFCGKKANTREHIIPKCFLDLPYPKDLPTIPSCYACNSSFSEDEQYLMYLIDFLKSIEENEGEFIREKAKKTYEHAQSLEDRMFESINIDENGDAFFAIETDRVIRIIAKIAHCLLADRYYGKFMVEAFSVRYQFMSQLSEYDQQYIRAVFNTQFQTGRFAYIIYSECEIAMLFSDFLVAYVTI